MTTTQSLPEQREYPLTDEQKATYRRDGFIQLIDVFGPAELAQLRGAVASAVQAETDRERHGAGVDGPEGFYSDLFNQKVNLWQRHPDVAHFVTQKRLGNIAARLEGVPMRIWHDQALFKEPRTGNNKTPWHQDAPYWPHTVKKHQTSIWIALKDATIVNGCMSFVGSTHQLGALPAIDLGNPEDIFKYAPHIKPVKPKAIELKAGSATFHNGLTFHYAGPNKSDGIREAFAIIYMPDGTAYDGKEHVVTDRLQIRPGQPLDGELFPLVSDVPAT